MRLNKYQAILVSKLVTEYLKDGGNDTAEDCGLMCQLEEDLGRYILADAEALVVSSLPKPERRQGDRGRRVGDTDRRVGNIDQDRKAHTVIV